MLNNQTYVNTTSTNFIEITIDFSYIGHIVLIYRWVVLAVVCQIIAVFGIGSNIVNSICFVKQGFIDPVNVSLLGMAISDLGSLLTVFWSNLCFSPSFSESDLPFDPPELQYLVSGMPHVTFASITAWITALVTLERCLCITAPLKIKTFITPKRVTIIVVSIFIIIISGLAPVYAVNKLDMKYFPYKNKTLIGLVHTEDRDRIEHISYIINNFALPLCAFIIIVVCTTILVLQLNIKTRWRLQSSSSTHTDNVSNKNRNVAKMVIVISAIFITCFIPNCVMFVAMSLIPSLSVNGVNRYYLFMFGGIGLVLESMNSSANIFIYYRMSSKYRCVFQQLFCRHKADM